jgi:hypothetical protein
MKTMARLMLVLALGAPTAVPAAEGVACPPEPAMKGMRERIASLTEQMDRIEWMTDREERRNLMDLHMKKMREGMREIRKRDIAPGCRLEMMGDMMDVMIRHQHAMHDPAEHR